MESVPAFLACPVGNPDGRLPRAGPAKRLYSSTATKSVKAFCAGMPIHMPIYMPIHMSIHMPAHVPTHVFIHMSTHMIRSAVRSMERSKAFHGAFDPGFDGTFDRALDREFDHTFEGIRLRVVLQNKFLRCSTSQVARPFYSRAHLESTFGRSFLEGNAWEIPMVSHRAWADV